MSVHNKTLQLIASKLGLSEEKKVLSKAAEYERLLLTKSIAGTNITDISKVLICLDLAADFYGTEFDMKAAIKNSGLKPIAYRNCRKTIESLLQLNNDRLTISQLCLTLQCTKVQMLADKILEEYQKQTKVEVDLRLPQYVCMAVYQACKINKVKIPKNKLLEKSRLRSTQWVKLDAIWSKFVDEQFAVTQNRGRARKNPIVNEKCQQNKNINDKITKDEKSKPEIEPYEDWKRRMLEEAYKELKALKLEKTKQNMDQECNKGEEKEQNKEKHHKEKECNEQSIKSRRSPRKTSLKYAPYPVKSSSKEQEHNKEIYKEQECGNEQHYNKEENKEYKEQSKSRRSPRKTPQKYTPYPLKSPSKDKCVQLLFPTNM